MLTGRAVPLRAAVDLAGLAAGDVRVEAVVGRVGAEGDLEETQVLALTLTRWNNKEPIFVWPAILRRSPPAGWVIRSA